MKKLPTALTVPNSNFRVWLTIAPPLEAIAPAPGKVRAGGAPGVAEEDDEADGASAWVAEIEIAGIDPVLLQECLDGDELRFDRVAQHGRLLRDGGAAEEDDARQHRREREADDHQPQRMRQPDQAAEQIGHGVQRDPEQHSREDQEQRGGERPGEHQQRCEQHNADAADRYRPSQIAAGGNTIISRDSHVGSFTQRGSAPLFRQTRPGSSPRKRPRQGDARKSAANCWMS